MADDEADDRLAALEEPQRRGDAAESIVAAELTARGVTVLRPDHDNAAYDLVVDVDGEFYRLQVKTAYESRNEGAVQFDTRSTRVKSDGYEREGYDGRADYFAVYDPYNDRVYLVTVEGTPNSSMSIRYRPAVNGNHASVNWHEEYCLDAVFPTL